ncbi:WD repeat protein [Cryptosporidium canis]|uniref:WD repeat protein n=1 Tax=Cryptosporidium canis TaxID=195482 RepID=A0ABQ8P365_9CRYT|nr:WD repeat protein [Cryptosporidium canis]KAJ1606121.1 WD repeat protein [Cryptosporidium canis]
MLLKELVSSAKISWCPSPNRDRLSLLALGGCGLNPCLSVGLVDITNSGKDIENIGTSPLSSRCTSIAWGSYNSEEGALGLICTGMEDGNMGRQGGRPGEVVRGHNPPFGGELLGVQQDRPPSACVWGE